LQADHWRTDFALATSPSATPASWTAVVLGHCADVNGPSSAPFTECRLSYNANGTSPVGARKERLGGCWAGEGLGWRLGPHRPLLWIAVTVAWITVPASSDAQDDLRHDKGARDFSVCYRIGSHWVTSARCAHVWHWRSQWHDDQTPAAGVPPLSARVRDDITRLAASWVRNIMTRKAPAARRASARDAQGR